MVSNSKNEPQETATMSRSGDEYPLTLQHQQEEEKHGSHGEPVAEPLESPCRKGAGRKDGHGVPPLVPDDGREAPALGSDGDQDHPEEDQQKGEQEGHVGWSWALQASPAGTEGSAKRRSAQRRPAPHLPPGQRSTSPSRYRALSTLPIFWTTPASFVASWAHQALNSSASM